MRGTYAARGPGARPRSGTWMARHCSPNRVFERSPRAGAARLGALALCAMAGCGTTRQPAMAQQATPPAASVTRAEPAAPLCPRLPRAARTWTGFAADVPATAPLHLTLDVLVPIQAALGALFCGAEHAPCRPAALNSVELTNASANAARVELDLGSGVTPLMLALREENGAWRAEPESLAAFMASCRAVRP